MIISIFGAGRSSYYAIEYLVTKASENNWQVKVYDRSPIKVPQIILDLTQVFQMDLADIETAEVISESNIVVSLLPANLHILIAKMCLEYNTHLATASFVSEEMLSLNELAKEKGLIFLNECGLDPGIDHMSTCEVIDQLQAKGAKILGIESYCGGLIAKEDCQNNPWQYKFAWSPRNVILAGQGAPSMVIRKGETRIVQWHQLFKTVNQLDLPGLGKFDAYPNRNSILYRELYHIPHVQTLIRGTLRRNGYCEAWQQLIEWGFTDNIHQLSGINNIREFARTMTGFDFRLEHWKEGLSNDCIEKIEFLALEREEPFTFSDGTPADFLLAILLVKWKMEETDKDVSILYHGISYELNGEIHKQVSTLQYFGKNSMDTAMAKLVGLPLAMGVELIANNLIATKGVQIPNTQEWYKPILTNLKKLGVEIVHTHSS